MGLRTLVEFRKIKREPNTATGPNPGNEARRDKLRLFIDDGTGEGLDLKVSEADFETFKECQKGDMIEIELVVKDAQAALGAGKGTYTVSQLSSASLVVIRQRNGKDYVPKAAH
jgi:hypothetical protein